MLTLTYSFITVTTACLNIGAVDELGLLVMLVVFKETFFLADKFQVLHRAHLSVPRRTNI